MRPSRVFPFETNRAESLARAANANIQKIVENNKNSSFLNKLQKSKLFQRKEDDHDTVSLAQSSITSLSAKNQADSSDETVKDDEFVDILDDDEQVSFAPETSYEPAVDPIDTMEGIKDNFTLLTKQIQEFKQKLLKSTEKIHEIEREKSALEDQKFGLEEENLLLRQNLIDTVEIRKKQESADYKHILNDVLRRKRYRTSAGNNDNNQQSNGNELLMKASLREFDEVDQVVSYQDLFTQTRNILQFVSEVLKRFSPFQNDIRQIEGRLGSSVASYFVFQRFLFIQFAIIGIFILAFAIYHIYTIIRDGNGSFIYRLKGFQPYFLLYSTFSSSEAVFYSWALVGTVILCTVIGIYKLGKLLPSLALP
jgi:hypothetical protein